MRHPAVRTLLFLLVTATLVGCVHAPAPVDTAAACYGALNIERVAYRPIEISESRDPRCLIPAPVRVSQIEVPLNQSATMSCLLANRLDAFERGALQQLAMADLGHSIVRIDHLGAYSCRVNTGQQDQLSEHAYGLAIDISGFRLSDGEIVSVERDWGQPGPHGAFLHQLAHAACDYFSVVLTPDSNAGHFNHFHLDIGPNRLCSL
jgi:hypothetical protein